MLSTRTDQAEGLRRLLTRGGLRVVSINAGSDGAACTAALINLAGALAERGADALILDARPGTRSVAAALGLQVRRGVEDVLRGSCDLDDAILLGPAGIRVLSLANGASGLAQRSLAEQRRLLAHCARLTLPLDTVLLDAGALGAVLGSGARTQEVIVVSGAGAGAITAAYALIKRLAQRDARREFHVLINAVAEASEAKAIFMNMAHAARRYLQVALRYMGHIPPDDRLVHAARLQLPVVAAFPAALAAGSFRGLAHVVAGWPRATEADSGFDEFMRRLIHRNDARAAAA